MKGESATFHNNLVLVALLNRPIWSGTCKNDNSAGLFLAMSPDPYFNFISGLFLSNHLKYLMILCRIIQQVNAKCLMIE